MLENDFIKQICVIFSEKFIEFSLNGILTVYKEGKRSEFKRILKDDIPYIQDLDISDLYCILCNDTKKKKELKDHYRKLINFCDQIISAKTIIYFEKKDRIFNENFSKKMLLMYSFFKDSRDCKDFEKYNKVINFEKKLKEIKKNKISVNSILNELGLNKISKKDIKIPNSSYYIKGLTRKNNSLGVTNKTSFTKINCDLFSKNTPAIIEWIVDNKSIDFNKTKNMYKYAKDVNNISASKCLGNNHKKIVIINNKIFCGDKAYINYWIIDNLENLNATFDYLDSILPKHNR